MKKFYAVTAIIIILFILMSSVSLFSIRQLQGNARVVNYCGIVRGGTQKLVKEELRNVRDDELINRLTSIINNLQTGQGANDLIVLQDTAYLDYLKRIQVQWAILQKDIQDVRQTNDEITKDKLFTDSQEYFVLVNDTVFAAEDYAEAQVNYIRSLLIGINIAFAVLFLTGIFFVLRGVVTSRSASNPDRASNFMDPMTEIDNRASCDRLISKINISPSTEDIAVIIFNMNNIKAVNDNLGKKHGDHLIIDFAHILKNTTKKYGFVGRYGGDEFLTIIAKANSQAVSAYLKELNKEVWSYNSRQKDHLKKISYAVGNLLGNLIEITIDDMIYQAYRNMTENKDKMKQGR